MEPDLRRSAVDALEARLRGRVPLQVVLGPRQVGKISRIQPLVDCMRLFIILALSAALLSACTPYIPIVSAFGTSAATPTGNIPPEFLDFNNYSLQADAIVSEQMCTTPYILDFEKSLRATPGEFIAWFGRCEPYEIRLDNLAQHFSP